MSDTSEGTADVSVFVCGDRTCTCDTAGPVVEFHDENGRVTAASCSCSKCGRTAMDRSLWDDD